MEHDERPWGKYFVLEVAATHKVKRIEVKPGSRLSYQYHNKRSEVWTIVKGKARVTLDGFEKEYVAGQIIEISLKAKHRVLNIDKETLIFIEVQLGTYFGEDDYNRN
jgi:mannose-6-phosphate isomerase